MIPFMHQSMYRRIVRAGLFCLLGLSVAACAAVRPMSYSLDDSEIFIAPRPHFLNLAVAVLEDRRSPEERAWASHVKLPSDLAGAITERIVRHLRVSSVFSKVLTVSGPVDPTSPDRARELVSQGADAVLAGDLIHFYGRTEPDRRIKGQVQFGNLKLYSTRTGQLLWQSTADKLLQRQETHPGRDEYYASEALRGAINQLAMQLAGLSFSHSQVYPSERSDIRHWRVGVLLPEDLRPAEEKDSRVRKLQGNLSYSLYSDTVRSVDKPFLCGFIMDCSVPIWEAAPFIDKVSDEWANKLQDAYIFEEVLSIKSRGETSEELHEWAEEGVDAVLVSQLTHSYASVIPSHVSRPFSIWSGGMGYRPLFKATALTRIQDVQLIETRTGKVLWAGEAEYGIDRTIQRWESPMILLKESLSGTLDRLVNQLSQYSPDSHEK